MTDVLPLILFMVIIGVGFFIFRAQSGGPTMVCTRCSGTGEVNEKWPDPAEPNGWHRVEGICPKCKGKGKVATARR